jgi:SAM-dependent methyltransferase
MSLYENPYYYDIAFGFRDIRREVNFFEECIKRFSKIKVEKVLDIGCGPSPYLLELTKRGYAFTGLDNSKKMLEYSVEKAEKAGVKIKTIQADMRNFKSEENFDFAFCMLGSIAVGSNEDFLSHLTAVSSCLNKGGLYLIDAVANFNWVQLGMERWTVLKEGLTVNVTWKEIPVNLVEQKVLEQCIVEVVEEGETKVLKQETLLKVIFPQEFLELVNRNKQFEFIGWYNNFDLNQPLDKATRFNRPITLLRRN